MTRAFFVAALALLIASGQLVAQTQQRPGTPVVSPTARGAVASGPSYFPDRFDWQHKKPEEVGMDPARISEAIKVSIDRENPGPKDMALFLNGSFGREPYSTIVGPIKDRGGASGLITRHGYVVAEWGDPNRVDITNSVTKTFLTTVVGLAWQRGLIRDVDDYVRDYMPPHVDLFDAPHNQNIKWDHLLRQTSDWQGTLWGKPDWADRPVGDKPEDWPNRKLYEPGTHFKYNDVRVNVMALAALQVWRRPLPEVLREEVMEPIGASSTWRWYGYENSWVDVDGRKVQSVSGGGHWGGGMFIDSYDMARFGYLFLPTASGTTGRSSRRNGSRWPARRAPTTRPTATPTGTSTPIRNRCRRPRQPRCASSATVRTSSTSTGTTTWWRCSAGSRATAR